MLHPGLPGGSGLQWSKHQGETHTHTYVCSQSFDHPIAHIVFIAGQ